MRENLLCGRWECAEINIVIYDIHEDYVTSILQKKYIPLIFRKLIAKGYKIIEKTGYYPCVFWVKSLVEPPYEYPAHMVLATIVSIVPPDGIDEEVITFGYHQLYAVPLPLTTDTKVVNGAEVTFPQNGEHYTASISNTVKNRVNRPFRSQMENDIKPLLPI